jgi:hypothetical protein
MDAAQVFVLVLTAVAVGILVYVELKSRRSKNQVADVTPLQQNAPDKKARRN